MLVRSHRLLPLLLASMLLTIAPALAQEPPPNPVTEPPAGTVAPEPVPDATEEISEEEPAAEEPAAAEATTAEPVRPHAGHMAPTIAGPTGLIRLVTTDIGAQHTFRVGFHAEFFEADEFLVNGDTNTRSIGTLALAYAPWDYIEIFANIRAASNRNERPQEDNRLDQELILAQGDFGFGAKGQYPITPFLGVGANFGLTFLNSVGGGTPDGDSTSFYIGAISSFDLDPLANFPVRFHFNFGYFLDNSDNLVSGEFANYSLASLQVEKFALGINRERLQFKLGVDAPLRRWTKIGVTPMLEFAADVATGDSDTDFDNSRFVVTQTPPPPGRITADDVEGRSTIWMTFGVRVNPIAGLNLGLAVDAGITSPGYGFGPPVVPWNLIMGLSYAYDPTPAPVTVAAAPPVVKEVVKEVAPKTGKIRGRVVDAKTMEPVEGAVVTFPGRDLTGLYTDPDGSFQSYALPPGQHALMVRKEGFTPAKLMVEVKADQVVPLNVQLAPEPPKVGTLRGRVDDLKGAPVVGATVKLTGPETQTAQVGPSGDFIIEVKPGRYELDVEAKNFLRKRGDVTVEAGGVAVSNFTISPKPKKKLVSVSANAVTAMAPIKFEENTANISPDSRQLLDALVDGLLGAPQIKKLEIQGHTDNKGSLAANMKLSQDRADAVMEYLVKGGVTADRLTARGYGPTRPKRPNITARNRAMNRRVEFLVLETE